jgi:putative flippase GtrA
MLQNSDRYPPEIARLPEMVQIFVSDLLRNRNVGSKLLLAAEIFLRQRGHVGYWLKTEACEENQALNFYRRRGFVEVMSRNDPTGKRYVYLRKSLASAIHGASPSLERQATAMLSGSSKALLAHFFDRSFLRWTLLSFFSFFLVLGSTFVLREMLGATELVSFGAALCIVSVVNFCTIKYLVFSSDQRYEARRQFLLYGLTTLGFRLSEYAIYWLILDLLNLHYLLAAVTVMCTSFLGKFLVSKLIIFRSHA